MSSDNFCILAISWILAKLDGFVSLISPHDEKNIILNVSLKSSILWNIVSKVSKGKRVKG